MGTVVHLTSDDDVAAGHAVRSAALLVDHDDLPHEAVAPLAHRAAIALLTPDSHHIDGVRDLLDRGVAVRAGATCVDAPDLPREALEGVEIVPSGVSELVRLQSAGYLSVKIP